MNKTTAKHRVEWRNDYDGWVVINPNGYVVAIYGLWEFALESALYRAEDWIN